MKIAVLGAGFAGLASCWHLLNSPFVTHVTLYDPQPIGHGVSGLSSGLLHPYGGKQAKRSAFASEGMAATRQLLDIASHALGKAIFFEEGIVRIPADEAQAIAFASRYANRSFDDLELWSTKRCCEMLPGIAGQESLFIKSAIRVHVPDYLKGLWMACERHGAQFEQRAVSLVEAEQQFDVVVLATGAAASGVAVEPVKGQILRLAWPTSLPPPPMSVIGKKYLVMSDDRRTCVVGATYEHNFSSAMPDLEFAKHEIMPAITTLYPALAHAEILDCYAGVRASTPDHMPVQQRISARCWVYTGLGSKGLLYHALFAQKLQQEICSLL